MAVVDDEHVRHINDIVNAFLLLLLLLFTLRNCYCTLDGDASLPANGTLARSFRVCARCSRHATDSGERRCATERSQEPTKAGKHKHEHESSQAEVEVESCQSESSFAECRCASHFTTARAHEVRFVFRACGHMRSA